MPAPQKYFTIGPEGPFPGHNPGLVYQKLAPITEGMQQYAEAVERIARSTIPHAYFLAYERWKRRTRPVPGRRRDFLVESQGRVACGLGEEFPGENGLSLLAPWGMPVLPGSSLKGVARAWAEQRWPDGLPDDLRDLFGSPGDDGAAGIVDFLDAWYRPEQGRSPFVTEVITAHYAGYYQSNGKTPAHGFEGPSPVRLLVVEGVFRVVLEGPDDAWLDLAEQVLVRALEEQGVGAKTRTGYGRFRRVGGRDADGPGPTRPGPTGTPQPNEQPPNTPEGWLRAAFAGIPDQALEDSLYNVLIGNEAGISGDVRKRAEARGVPLTPEGVWPLAQKLLAGRYESAKKRVNAGRARATHHRLVKAYEKLKASEGN